MKKTMKNILLPSVIFAVSTLLSLLPLSVFGQQNTEQRLDQQLTKQNAMERAIEARAGQIISTGMDAKGGRILFINSEIETGDADFISYGFDGLELDRTTIELPPFSTMAIVFSDVFPTLDSSNVGEIKIQVSVRPKQEMSASDARELPIAFFSQNWYADQLGTCRNTTIRTAGCAITAISMALARRNIPNQNPSTLNAWLRNNNGYDNGCLVKWARAADFDGSGGFAYIGNSSVSVANLKSTIDNNRFAIARSSRGGSSHYVIVFGYRNSGSVLSDFYYADPADNQFVRRYVGDNWVRSGNSVKVYQ